MNDHTAQTAGAVVSPALASPGGTGVSPALASPGGTGVSPVLSPGRSANLALVPTAHRARAKSRAQKPGETPGPPRLAQKPGEMPGPPRLGKTPRSPKPRGTPVLVRVLQTSCAVTPRLLRASATLGLGVQGPVTKRTQRVRRICELLRQEGSVVHLGGASGCGKSTTLRQCVALLREEGRSVIVAGEGEAPSACSLVDCMPGQLDAALRMLGAAGLAEGRLLGRSLHELSEGQRARALLAQALARSACDLSELPIVIVVDELASTLDSVTAQGLCRALRRCIAAHGLALLSASAREDVAAWLCPDATTKSMRGVCVHVARGEA